MFDVMRDYLSFGALAFVVTAVTTPLVAVLARRLRVMDMPDQELKPHARPTPYMGGVAICGGWAIAILAAMAMLPEMDRSMLIWLLVGGVAISIMGLLDDILELPARIRILAGAAILLIVLLFSGAGHELVWMALKRFVDIPRPVHGAFTWPVAVSTVLGVMLVLGACNSTNLIDGLDGLSAGVTAIISLGFFLLAADLAGRGLSRDADDVRLVLSIAMFGATVGFLLFNFNPARIFMGDAGSILLGYNCGVLILLFAGGGVNWAFGGLMVFAVPVLDTALAIVRRWRCGKPILQGDRSHFYDQLVDRGYSVRQVVVICYALTAIYAAVGLAPIWLRLRYILVLYAIVLVLTVVGIVWARMVRVDDPRPAPPPSESAGSA